MKASISTEERIKEFKEFRDIGETFNFLGITCLVVRFESDIMTVDYVDNHGVLQFSKFTYEDLPLLKKQNEEK